MNIPKYSIDRCTTNPKRWIVTLNISKPFSSSIIEKIIEKTHYQILAASPNVYVFKSNDFRLTMHSYGLIQIDVYHSISTKIKDIEQLIKHIFAHINE